MAEHWSGYAVPPMRDEALYGDRLVRCFAERPASLLAMFEHSVATRAEHDAVVCA
jgi:long-chain acyl-CoA synthetase